MNKMNSKNYNKLVKNTKSEKVRISQLLQGFFKHTISLIFVSHTFFLHLLVSHQKLSNDLGKILVADFQISSHWYFS